MVRSGNLVGENAAEQLRRNQESAPDGGIAGQSPQQLLLMVAEFAMHLPDVSHDPVKLAHLVGYTTYSLLAASYAYGIDAVDQANEIVESGGIFSGNVDKLIRKGSGKTGQVEGGKPTTPVPEK